MHFVISLKSGPGSFDLVRFDGDLLAQEEYLLQIDVLFILHKSHFFALVSGQSSYLKFHLSGN